MRPLLTEDDVYLFNEGTNSEMYRHLGAQTFPTGTHFAVWAPNARRVAVVGDFNGWDPDRDEMFPTSSGIWKKYIDNVPIGATYKYLIDSRSGRIEKADPYGFTSEIPPKSASVVWDLGYEWNDQAWMKKRWRRNRHDAPISTYEMHLGSWRKMAAGESPSYRDLAPMLAEYLTETGFTHVEFLPVTEHPYFPSWGYQATGYFAPTSRYGTPQDFMYLVDYLHQHDIGVILDWVPSHFAVDAHGLSRFDGTSLYEHPDPQRGWHPDWDSYIFNYGRNEVRSFLLSSARFWLDVYHVDGLRVDAVASMLYLDYSREEGEWAPNVFGGNENLEAMALLRDMNRSAYANNARVMTIAEESTAFPGVSRPVDVGGLGFGYKWDMGWMHDTLGYFARDPIHRSHHHNELTFRQLYAYDENFVLALSHDEVVHGKGSLINKMPGSEWQQFANLRLLLGYMYGLPGKKLLFMGAELAQRAEWNPDTSLEWFVLDHANHAGMLKWVADLNALYRKERALFEQDYDSGGFEWVDASDSAASILSFVRWSSRGDPILVVLNLTPAPRSGYRIGVPTAGRWRVLLNSDAQEYWGSGAGTTSAVRSDDVPADGREASVAIDLPPLGALFLKGPRSTS